MTCKERLEQYLRDNAVPYVAMNHPPAFTAPEAAAALHIPGRQFVKVVMIKAGERIVMCAVPANKHVDLRILAALLNEPEARLAREEEFAALFPDCLLGAMPPFGHFYGVPVYVDATLNEAPEIAFPAGTHTDTLKVRLADYLRLASPVVESFTL